MVKHLLKDLAIARECAAATKIDLPGLATAERLFTLAADRGWADDGTQVLYRLYSAPEGLCSRPSPHR
jgi:3-hydroxyisobutyrate dehydrogenase